MVIGLPDSQSMCVGKESGRGSNYGSSAALDLSDTMQHIAGLAATYVGIAVILALICGILIEWYTVCWVNIIIYINRVNIDNAGQYSYPHNQSG